MTQHLCVVYSAYNLLVINQGPDTLSQIEAEKSCLMTMADGFIQFYGL